MVAFPDLTLTYPQMDIFRMWKLSEQKSPSSPAKILFFFRLKFVKDETEE